MHTATAANPVEHSDSPAGQSLISHIKNKNFHWSQRQYHEVFSFVAASSYL